MRQTTTHLGKYASKPFRNRWCKSKIPDEEDKRIMTEQQELLVIGLLLDAPILYLSEFCQMVLRITGVQVSPPAICQIIHRNGLTRKKVQQIALQILSVYHGDFMAEVQCFSPDKFFWVDETGCKQNAIMGSLNHTQMFHLHIHCHKSIQC